MRYMRTKRWLHPSCLATSYGLVAFLFGFL
jgi:hypothetical protein